MEQAPRATIQCHRCHGTGRIPAPPGLQATLGLFKAKSRFTAEELRKLLIDKKLIGADVTTSAISNRLARLLFAGHLTRFRDGMVWRYAKVRGAGQVSESTN